MLCIFLSSALPCVLSSPLLGVSARRFLFLRARSQQVLLRGHEQVSRESRREKGRGVGRKQQTRATAGDGAPRAEATRRVKSIGGEASSAQGRPLCVIGAYQRAERIFAEVGYEADRFSALCQLEDWQSQVATARDCSGPYKGHPLLCAATGMPLWAACY